VSTDAQAAAVVARARASGAAVPVVGLVGGDLCLTLGGRGDPDRLRALDAPRLPVDVGWVRLDDGEELPFVAHVVARRWGWRGRFVVVMNAERIGSWKLAPRAHPGDGRVDVLDGALPLDARLAARSRVRTGDHVPHPAIAERRVRSFDVDLGATLRVVIDGAAVGRARRLAVRVDPQALTVVV